MPNVNFTGVEDVQDFDPVPDGTYPCKLVDLDERTTQNGDEMWRLRFEVTKGKHEKRLIFDNMVFSEAANGRLKLICQSLGIDVSGQVDLTPQSVIGRRCLIKLGVVEYVNGEGNSGFRNTVPFAGYAPLKEDADESTDSGSESDDGSTPF